MAMIYLWKSVAYYNKALPFTDYYMSYIFPQMIFTLTESRDFFYDI